MSAKSQKGKKSGSVSAQPKATESKQKGTKTTGEKFVLTPPDDHKRKVHTSHLFFLPPLTDQFEQLNNDSLVSSKKQKGSQEKDDRASTTQV